MCINGRKFLVITTKINYSGNMIRRMIPEESILSINEFDNNTVRVDYMLKGEEKFAFIEEPFTDIINGKCSVEL